MWLVYHNKLNTRDNLVRKKIYIVSQDCVLCDQLHESIDNLFLDCNVSVKLWKISSNIGKLWRDQLLLKIGWQLEETIKCQIHLQPNGALLHVL